MLFSTYENAFKKPTPIWVSRKHQKKKRNIRDFLNLTGFGCIGESLYVFPTSKSSWTIGESWNINPLMTVPMVVVKSAYIVSVNQSELKDGIYFAGRFHSRYGSTLHCRIENGNLYCAYVFPFLMLLGKLITIFVSQISMMIKIFGQLHKKV